MFQGCRGRKNMLPFDFYVSSYNLLIEYHGQQHFDGGLYIYNKDDAFSYRQQLDSTKRNFCANNGINLLEITYKQDVPKALAEYFKAHCS
jgi:hypothetical protein